MKTKLLTTAALAAFIAAGGAFAQTAGNNSNGAPFASPEEEAMYTENAELMGGFFTDETMKEMRSEDEVRTAYDGMSAEDKDKLKAACDAAMQNRGSYGTVTLGLCEQLGAM